MYHSIEFGDKNTWEDWHLIPTSRPVVSPPSPKTQAVEIPGANGQIDMTEALTGYPLYSNRTGSFEFIVVNDTYSLVEYHEDWAEVYSEISNYLHGRKMKMVLEDDPDWYYEGRFAVNSWKSGDHFSNITIDYNVEPFKWAHKTQKKEYSLTTTAQTHTLTSHEDHFGIVPVTPIIDVSILTENKVSIQFINRALSIDVTEIFELGENRAPRMVMYGDEVTLTLKTTAGTGTVIFEYKEGSL